MEKVDELAFGVERLTGSPELPDKARYSRCWSFRQKTSIENTLRPPATSQHCTLGILCKDYAFLHRLLGVIKSLLLLRIRKSLLESHVFFDEKKEGTISIILSSPRITKSSGQDKFVCYIRVESE